MSLGIVLIEFLAFLAFFPNGLADVLSGLYMGQLAFLGKVFLELG